MKVIIAGGRDTPFTLRNVLWLDAYMPDGVTEIVSGGAKGADALGERWALKQGIPLTIFKAEWDKHGKAAGMIRNREMAEYADVLIVFPGGRGTANMIKEATKCGLTIIKREDYV